MSGLVVVTGASTGIGRATAVHLQGLGYEVLAGVRKREDGEALRDLAPVVPVILDVTEPGQIDALAATVGDRPLAGLVNNAGVSVNGPLEFMPLDELRRQLEVNLIGQVAVTQPLVEALRRGNGRIVFTGSVGGRVALPFLGAYAASKAGIASVAEALRGELRPWGIHVAVVEPGAIATEIWSKAGEGTAPTAAALGPRGVEHYGATMGRVGAIAAEMSKDAIPAEKVAKAIEHALTARRPKARYLIGRDARQQALGRRLLGHRRFDAFVAKQMGL
jgi:NAD(P)-dependent dehydrogenase (short-subunit alcohol dehydrogenase family)